MEKRNAIRKLTQTRVVLHHDSFDSTPLNTKDMSQGGVFVNTPTPVELKPGTSLAMTFMIDLGGVVKLRKVTATVVQSTAEGIGLRFSP